MKRYRKLFILGLGSTLIGFALSALPCTALAELYECNGVWRNTPCNGATRSLAEVVSTKGTPYAPDYASETAGNTLNAGGSNRCPEGQSFFTSRPDPDALWKNEALPSSKDIESKVKLTGTVTGHGDVCLNITASGYKYGRTPETLPLLSRKVRLPDDGGEAKFDHIITFPRSYQWDAQFQNCGSFAGYCTSAHDRHAKELARARRETEAVRQAANAALEESQRAREAAEAAMYEAHKVREAAEFDYD